MKRLALLILDGWGISNNPKVSAINLGKTPNMDFFLNKYPNTRLSASGLDVGLPNGQMGNSEVGHINLGAGRIVYQNLVKINLAIEKNTFFKKTVLQECFKYSKIGKRKIHLIGLLSDGGVHSHINHLKALIDAAEINKLNEVYIHAFTDGRDSDPRSGKKFIKDIIEKTKNTKVQLASICGRYYAMDRDKRWERIKVAYDAIVNQVGFFSETPINFMEKLYQEGITDEFIKPIIILKNGYPVTKIEDKDVVICFNFRTDRSRQITEVISQKNFLNFGMKKLNVNYITMTDYDPSYKNIKVIFRENSVINTLGEILEKKHKTQIRIAETEKYPHVTFFFSGGKEERYQGEKRIICQSPKDVPTYDLKPEMAAFDIKNLIIREIHKNPTDFICLNFANADMVGHTGNMQSTIKACEVVDQCVGEVVSVALKSNYTLFILSDHGNSDLMINPDGSPNTQHSNNPVPFIVIDNNKKYKLTPGKLGDIAPSILNILGIEIPQEMTGNIIVQ